MVYNLTLFLNRTLIVPSVTGGEVLIVLGMTNHHQPSKYLWVLTPMKKTTANHNSMEARIPPVALMLSVSRLGLGTKCWGRAEDKG